MAKLTTALVLCDVVAHALKAGTLVEASPDLIKTLAKSGEVDDHKDAVAYAKSQGAAVTRSCIELAAERRAARADELRVDIAKLDDLAAKPDADEATKAALTRQRLELQVELDALVAQG